MLATSTTVRAAAIVCFSLGLAAVDVHADEGDDWISLIRAGGLGGWRETGKWVNAAAVRQDPQNPKRLLIDSGSGHGTLANGSVGRTKNLVTEREFGDIELHVEFMVPAGSNSGVYFMGRYEIQVLDSWGTKKPKYSDCGGIYQRWDRKRPRGKQGYEGHAPRVNASRPPGEWQSFDVIFRAPRFDDEGKRIAKARFIKVAHNGVVIHQDVELGGPTRAATYPEDEKPRGPLMLQGDHGPVAYRNLRVRPLKDERSP